MSKNKNNDQSLGEEIGNAITHGLGFIFGIVATILMYVKASHASEYIGVTFFSIGLMILYIMSCLYHAFKKDSRVKRVFKRFDHLSIYLLIGGTFAPILLVFAKQPMGLIFFLIQWAFIILGVTLKSIDPYKFHKFHVLFYVIIGWSGLIICPQLINSNMALFWLILSGGITYTLGISFYALRFKYAHFVWHFFCLFGTILHFIAIYAFIL